MKTEPDQFSIDDLIAAPDHTDCWDGVRNYQARNFMRDDFKLGDQILIYHSRTSEPGVVGIAKVVKEAYADDTALDVRSKYFDEKSKKQGESRWCMVDIKATHKFTSSVSLSFIKGDGDLKSMKVAQRGMRLSIQPVEKVHFDRVRKLGKPQTVS